MSLAGVPLPQVAEYPHLGVTLTTSLSWVPNVRKLTVAGPSSVRPMRVMVYVRTPPCSVRLTPFPDVCVAECVLGLRVLSWFCSRHALVRWSTTSLVSMPSGVASWFSERGSARGSGQARHATTCHRQVAVSPRSPQLLTHGRSFSRSCTGVPGHVCLSQTR